MLADDILIFHVMSDEPTSIFQFGIHNDVHQTEVTRITEGLEEDPGPKSQNSMKIWDLQAEVCLDISEVCVYTTKVYRSFRIMLNMFS